MVCFRCTSGIRLQPSLETRRTAARSGSGWVFGSDSCLKLDVQLHDRGRFGFSGGTAVGCPDAGGRKMTLTNLAFSWKGQGSGHNRTARYFGD